MPDGKMVVLNARDDAAWMGVLEASYQHDFHHLPGYHRFAERRCEGQANLFAYREGDIVLGLPLLLRPVDPDDLDGLQDATSVYGYAGPVASHPSIPPGVVRSFQAALEAELVRRRVIAVFSRLHPLIAQRDLLAGLGEIGAAGVTVSVDLTLAPDEQWAGYSKKTRRIIRKAEEAGVTCIHDTGGVYRAEWVDLYQDTMRRVGAASSYMFDSDDFDALAAELGAILHLFVALLDGKVAAAGLYTICDGIAQAHLGAMNRDYAQLSPTRLLDDTARRWAVEAGARVFHLGGGVGGQEDSLFLYKSGFSDRRHEFAVWRWIVDQEAYGELCDRMGQPTGHLGTSVGRGGYFPAYRQPTGHEGSDERREAARSPSPTSSPASRRTLRDPGRGSRLDIDLDSAVRARIIEPGSAAWSELLAHAAHDFYHLPGYVCLAAAEEGGLPGALLVEGESRHLLLPLIVRPIPGSVHHDATSPYGYPGPLVRSGGDPTFEAEAWRVGLAALRDAGIVSVFVRLHPLLNGRPPAGIGHVVLHGETVSIALDLPASALWEQLRQNHRRGIRKAVQRGLTAREDPGFERYPDFRELYRATMQRRSASEYYFFSESYFAGLRRALGDSLHLIVVEAGDQVAAAGLFVETGGIVQYHLGGTHEAFSRDEPSKLLFYFASEWARQRGNHHLHLGGGVGGADDSLFHFKAGFSNVRHPYRTLRVVLDAEEYERLAAARAGGSQPEDLGGYFPTYRED